jgi:hypothetical protein
VPGQGWLDNLMPRSPPKSNKSEQHAQTKSEQAARMAASLNNSSNQRLTPKHFVNPLGALCFFARALPFDTREEPPVKRPHLETVLGMNPCLGLTCGERAGWVRAAVRGFITYDTALCEHIYSLELQTCCTCRHIQSLVIRLAM